MKKYNQKANVKAGTPEIADTLKQLTNNSTLDELMGIEKTQDKAAIANKAVLGQIELGQANEAVEAAVLHRLDAVVVQLQPLQLLEAGKHAGGH